MRNTIAKMSAVSIPLVLSVSAAFAGEAAFHTPTTDRAQQTKPLLSRAAVAVRAEAPRSGGHIRHLWVFPTGDENIVFAQYVVEGGRHSTRSAVESHLELLKLEGERIVEREDLTRKQSGAPASLSAKLGTLNTSGSRTTIGEARSAS